MKATARITAVAEAGRTRLVTLRSEPPLLVRRTGHRGPAAGPLARGSAAGAGEVEVHLVGGAAGPLGGDRLRVEVTVGPGARLCVRTVAASLALPGPRRAERAGTHSTLDVHATVAAGGSLRWLPEPLIAARGCDHVSSSLVDLESDASLTWREEVVCGRHGEDPGDASLHSTVRLAGRTLMRQELAVGPRAAGWAGAAVLGGGRATGTLLVVDPQWTEKPPEAAVLGPGAALMPLAGGPAALASAVGGDLREVRAALDRAFTQATLA
ncbi:urease accessory protein UreD [Phytohabitans suffuscus]|uniref:Urease accessory protein UreD n=1 Tax=Phytohabitans suffuscus TaxID=624315 RepID=A0A6F8YT72_9ACTN|nr:urease accessory protein UreD [Phytohabitans suffuscus]BCB89031.1 urease accessory protein UreD [Phytohabitans suffuscus]